MYDIKQFRTALYLLIALGISGFALSSQSPGLWVFAMALVGLNAWLMKTRQFRPLPRIVANAAALLAIAYVLVGFSGASASPILAIGQFLVILQLVKLWEQRANRDYAQLLILSLLLMVSAAISTYSLIFGVMFIIYLFLSLYCCLLFHLKAETDDARAALAVPEQRVNLNTLRQDQYHLPSSMRRLTGLVSAFAITFAVIVFLVFLRGPGANMFGQFQWRHTESLTGFSEQVSFQQVAKISQNYDEVATVKLWKNGQLVAGTEPLLLRGLTHEVYNGDDTEHGGAYQWSRTVGSSKSDEPPQDFDSMGDWHPRDAQNNEVYRQEIKLAPTGTPVIFSIGGPVRFSPGPIPGALRKMKLGYSAADEVFMASDAIPQPLTYTMMASGELGNEAPSLDPAQRKSKIDPLISQYARRPEVSGVGLLARREALVGAMPRDLPQVTDLDEQIAKNIETHLRTTFRYTLDLTEAERIQGQDPVVAFLYNFKRGHCEYFAGAMTLLCQSLGMQARMAVGFKCDDYNNYGHYYSVKQSHAHAWVEVYTTHGWKTFDPTSGRESALIAQSTWDKARHLFNFMEYTWANAVIAYDSNNRDNILQRVDTGLTNSAIRGSFALIRVRDFFNWVGETIGTKFVAPIIGILVLAMLVLLGWFLFERFKIRKRVSRIGIQSLPASAQMRLVRQLGFYDELLQLLERYDIVREKHFTPLEFSDSLAFLPTEIYSTVQRLTGLFYKIRFGHAELDAGRQRRLAVVINRLSECLARERSLLR